MCTVLVTPNVLNMDLQNMKEEIMESVSAPTQAELWNEELVLVHEDHRPIRWGYLARDVFKKEEEYPTYWLVTYKVENEGDYNTLRDGGYEIEQVFPTVEPSTVFLKEKR
jgi:hypothetical protein